jgi:hypothetical protein
VPVRYETQFRINWPEHLGGRMTVLVLEGSMFLVPSLGS